MESMSCWGITMNLPVFCRMVPRMSAAASPMPSTLEGVLFWKLTTPTLSFGPLYSDTSLLVFNCLDVSVKVVSSLTAPDVVGRTA